jgi:hypothetical protein
MHADFKIVLDACVLANQRVCDLFLSLAETPRLYLPKWSEAILEEVKSTHLGPLQWPEEIAASWQAAVRSAFPEAMIPGYERYLPLATNEEKDRHVLAAAIC